jgi:hypothetical protein
MMGSIIVPGRNPNSDDSDMQALDLDIDRETLVILRD